jgi:hypothetical protein
MDDSVPSKNGIRMSDFPLALLGSLCFGHALMDYALQSNAMANEKSRHSNTPLQKEVPWFYWLSAHAALHGGAVGYLTTPLLGFAEFIAHWVIDFIKCEKYTNIHSDQLLHLFCKLVWCFLMMRTAV